LKVKQSLSSANAVFASGNKLEAEISTWAAVATGQMTLPSHFK